MAVVAYTGPIIELWKKFNKEIATFFSRFLSVVVITCPSHGQGRRFDPGRNHDMFFFSVIVNSIQSWVIVTVPNI
jgi:hypothetical protein